MLNSMFCIWWNPVSSWPCRWQRTLNRNRKNESLCCRKTTWAMTQKQTLASHTQDLPFCLFLCPFYCKRDFKTEMKIPFLCNVYTAFSHIRSRSVCSLPPLFSIFPDASGLEPAIDFRWKGRKKGEDGNEAEGRDKRSLQGLWCLAGLVLLSDHASPHVHSSPWRRCVRGCSGSAMGRDNVWADKGFLPNYHWCVWSSVE